MEEYDFRDEDFGFYRLNRGARPARSCGRVRSACQMIFFFTHLHVSSSRSPDDDNPDEYDLIVILLRYSTRQNHDESERSIFRICRANKSDGAPATRLEVCGENLAFVILFPSSTSSDNDYMCVFNWKTGTPKAVRG